jgi:hypothetical protein
MLKITIDNEEVLSNKNFTIEEEMLNTPSVVLDNVYPKSWENDKDYTSRFYHPNDYSKCLIKDEIYTPAEPGLNVEGTSFQITADTTKQYELTSMKGNTTQSGTPTPTAPVPINVVSGDNEINVCGKNIYNTKKYNFSFNQTTYEALSNILQIKNNYGGIPRIIETDTNYFKMTASTTYDNAQVWLFSNLQPNTNYNISCNVDTNITNGTMWLFGTARAITTKKLSQSFTTNASGEFSFSPMFYCTGTKASGNYIELSNIMLEKGSATTYEPYQGQSYPINLGDIELCKIGNYQDRIYKNNGKWYLEKNIGKVVLDGSENWNIGGTYQGITQFQTRAGVSLNPQGVLKTLSNYFKGVKWADSWKNDKSITSGAGILRVMTSDFTTVDAFKTWLNTHNTIVYCVLATPTTTEITDTELISQLESIELLEGLNNVSVVSPYLQGIINIHYNFVNEETTSNLLFCGVVKNSGNISLNPRYPHYQSLQILDFKTFLSEGETLDFVIANKTIEEAIDQIISTIAPYGFVKGNIQIIGADTIIGAYSTKDKTAYDVFNYLADITQSRWTTRMIDENTVAIDFYDPTLLPQGTPINYNETWFRDNLIDDMSYSYGSNDYRNKQVMTSNEVYGSILQTQTIVANGYQTQFDTELKIGQITSITANGTQLTIATNEQKELGFNADIYYTPGNNYFESADLRSTGEILIVNYIAIVEGRQIITNGTEINRVATATGRKGIVARYENRNDANTSNELQLIGQSYIRYKGTPEIKLTIVSRKNLWNIGDRVQFNAPINELATEYMVKKKTINRILANPSSEEHIVYTYEITSSFNSEQAINYFDNQRAKAKGNIGESEYITRNVDIESIANIIFYGSNIEQATITGDNTLQATLSSPIIN